MSVAQLSIVCITGGNIVKKTECVQRWISTFAAVLWLFLGGVHPAELVAFWPLDELNDDGQSSPDVANGLDMQALNLSAGDLVPGKVGNAISFSNANQTLLSRISAPEDPLPINKHPAFTISMWSNVQGAGQNDLRLFSEASTTDNNPLFNLGTDNAGAGPLLDFYIRDPANGNNGHPRSSLEPFDNEWRHLGWVYQDGTHTLYVDGVKDDTTFDWPAFSDGDPFLLDTTSIGGIQRAAPSHWVTGLIDEVAVWDEALSDAAIADLAAGGCIVCLPEGVTQGDFNADGLIDTTDFGIMAANFNASFAREESHSRGDYDLNTRVDIQDFMAFRDAYLALPAGAVAAVPEPATFTLLAICAGCLVAWRRRRPW